MTLFGQLTNSQCNSGDRTQDYYWSFIHLYYTRAEEDAPYHIIFSPPLKISQQVKAIWDSYNTCTTSPHFSHTSSLDKCGHSHSLPFTSVECRVTCFPTVATSKTYIFLGKLDGSRPCRTCLGELWNASWKPDGNETSALNRAVNSSTCFTNRSYIPRSSLCLKVFLHKL